MNKYQKERLRQKRRRNDRLIREVDEALTVCEREVRKLLDGGYS